MAEKKKPSEADGLLAQIEAVVAEAPPSFKPPVHESKPGPKPKPIPWGVVKNMAAYFCPVMDICAGLELSYNQVNERCKEDNGMTIGEFLSWGEGQGRNEIRKQQMILLQRGNAGMAKWLGMQHLGQAPVVKITHKVNSGATPPEPPTGFQIMEVDETGTAIGAVAAALPIKDAEVCDGPAPSKDNPNPGTT